MILRAGGGGRQTGDDPVPGRGGRHWVKNRAWADPDQALVRNTMHDDSSTARRIGRQIRLDLGLEAEHHADQPQPETG